MSNETRQTLWEAAGRFHADATDTAELEAALTAHKKDEAKPPPKAKAPKPAATKTEDDGA